jgi:protease IV
VDAIAGGRVWDGGTARQLGLVDQFGGLEDALAWAAAKAGAKEGEFHAVYLGEQDANYDSLIRQLVTSASVPATAAPTGDLFALAAQRNGDLAARLARDAERLLGTRGVQAMCLDCPDAAPPSSPSARPQHPSGITALLGWLMAP